MTARQRSRASDALTAALLALASRGQRPRCGDPGARDLWLSDDYDERAQAAAWCNGCPVWQECGAAAESRQERFGVWAGQDRTPDTRTKRAAQ